MSKFFLTGMKYSIFGSMKICPQVKDKCCTIADEIWISKLWKNWTKALIGDKIDQIINMATNIFDDFEYI